MKYSLYLAEFYMYGVILTYFITMIYGSGDFKSSINDAFNWIQIYFSFQIDYYTYILLVFLIIVIRIRLHFAKPQVPNLKIIFNFIIELFFVGYLLNLYFIIFQAGINHSIVPIVESLLSLFFWIYWVILEDENMKIFYFILYGMYYLFYLKIRFNSNKHLIEQPKDTKEAQCGPNESQLNDTKQLIQRDGFFKLEEKDLPFFKKYFKLFDFVAFIFVILHLYLLAISNLMKEICEESCWMPITSGVFSLTIIFGPFWTINLFKKLTKSKIRIPSFTLPKNIKMRRPLILPLIHNLRRHFRSMAFVYLFMEVILLPIFIISGLFFGESIKDSLFWFDVLNAVVSSIVIVLLPRSLIDTHY